LKKYVYNWNVKIYYIYILISCGNYDIQYFIHYIELLSNLDRLYSSLTNNTGINILKLLATKIYVIQVGSEMEQKILVIFVIIKLLTYFI